METGRCAAFHQAAGYTVVQTASGVWYNASAFFYECLPPGRPIEPSADELRTLLVSRRILGVRFANRCGRGIDCHLYAVRDAAYDEHCLHRSFRQNVIRGRAACEVRELDAGELHRFGMAVTLDARARRAHVDPHLVDPALWRRYCDAVRTSPGVVVFGCFAARELASWIIAVVEDGTCWALHMMSRADLRGLRPNNLLYYEFTRRMLARDDVECVNTGLEPILPGGNIDRFKRHAGYVKEPCRLAVAFHPVGGALLLGRGATRLIDIGGRFFPAQLAQMRSMIEIARATSKTSQVPGPGPHRGRVHRGRTGPTS